MPSGVIPSAFSFSLLCQQPFLDKTLQMNLDGVPACPSNPLKLPHCHSAQLTGGNKYILKDMHDEDRIMGTDMSELALDTARRGVYPSWSFRGVSSNVQTRFFAPSRHEWQLKPLIRDRVQFQHNNLYLDPFPDPIKGLHDFDLILCRNVFIYLLPEAIADIQGKFYACLLDGYGGAAGVWPGTGFQNQGDQRGSNIIARGNQDGTTRRGARRPSFARIFKW